MDRRSHRGSVALGRFVVQVDSGCLSIRDSAGDGRVLLETAAHGPALWARWGKTVVEESRGYFRIQTHPREHTLSHGPPVLHADGNTARIVWHTDNHDRRTFTLEVSTVNATQLRLQIRLNHGTSTDPDHLGLRIQASPEERVFGFGAQFTHLNVKGRALYVLSQEPGIGRGIQPLTWMLDRLFQAGGTWSSSNAPVPFFLTTRLSALALGNKELSHFSFTDPHITEISVHAPVLDVRLFAGTSPAELVEAYSALSGRMRNLPDWIGDGAIVGVQGGRAAVDTALKQLETHRAPVAAVWIQDWVGCRRTSIGKQLWWNWEPDDDAYPQWAAFVDHLRARGIRTLGYINPFLVDANEKERCHRNLYAEAAAKGYLVRSADGSTYPIQNTSFSAGLMDLTNPDACQWLKDIIREQLLGSGMCGYMADFGEALPFDAVLHDGSDAAHFHNRYPEEWARLNREAIAEAGLEEEAVFFCRAGFTESPAFATLFWLGDQLTSWRQEDGIKSVVIGLLSSGMCGFAFNHGDVGGYTATTIPRFPVRVPGLFYARDRELLWRWIELCAFTPVFRTHEGNQPEVHHQIFDDDDSLSHFSRFARVYAALAPYRRRLGREAATRGLPLVRSLWFCFPNDSQAAAVDDQFLLGADVLVAPVMERGATQRRVYLPEGDWVHLWSGAAFQGGGARAWCVVDAPLGEPPVFVRRRSDVLAECTSSLVAHHDITSSEATARLAAASESDHG